MTNTTISVLKKLIKNMSLERGNKHTGILKRACTNIGVLEMTSTKIGVLKGPVQN